MVAVVMVIEDSDMAQSCGGWSWAANEFVGFCRTRREHFSCQRRFAERQAMRAGAQEGMRGRCDGAWGMGTRDWLIIDYA